MTSIVTWADRARRDYFAADPFGPLPRYAHVERILAATRMKPPTPDALRKRAWRAAKRAERMSEERRP
jgi:hypothetical protein